MSQAAQRLLTERLSRWERGRIDGELAIAEVDASEDVHAVARAYLKALETLWEIVTYDMTSPGPPIVQMQEIARAFLAEHEQEPR